MFTFVQSGPQVLDACGADVHSDCPAEPDSLVKSLNITPTTATTRVRAINANPFSRLHHNPTAFIMQRMVAETPSDITSQPTACDTMSRPSIAEDAGTSAEILATSFPATTNNKAQGSSMAPTDLNYLDGPTIIDEVCQPHHIRVSIHSGCNSLLSHFRRRSPLQFRRYVGFQRDGTSVF